MIKTYYFLQAGPLVAKEFPDYITENRIYTVYEFGGRKTSVWDKILYHKDYWDEYY